MSENQAYCCYIPDGQQQHCTQAATWEIHYSADPQDYTHACTNHVGTLLSDAPVHHVYHIDDIAAISKNAHLFPVPTEWADDLPWPPPDSDSVVTTQASGGAGPFPPPGSDSGVGTV